MGDCGINDQMHAGNNRIAPHSTATQNVQKNDLKVRSDSNNLQTKDHADGDLEIAPTSATPALAFIQASKDTVCSELKTTACNPVEQTCLNSQLVTAYLENPDKCSILETICFKKNFASARLSCQGD